MSWVSADDYRAAEPDPLAEHAPGILAHMNEDHADAVLRYATVLAGIAAIAVGDLAATLLDRRIWSAYGPANASERPRPVRLVLLGGMVAGVTLLLIAAGTGQPGNHLAAGPG